MKKLMQQYLEALQKADEAMILSFFSDGATVDSPLYGRVLAREFYPRLFQDTDSSTIQPLHFFIDGSVGVAHFRYDWVLSDGSSTSFQCADIFDFDGAKIRHLTIIYDTQHIRRAFEKVTTRS